MYVYMNMYMNMYMYVCIYIHEEETFCLPIYETKPRKNYDHTYNYIYIYT